MIHDGHDGAAQQAQQNTGEHREDHVAGIVDVQVQPGKSHQESNDGGGDAQPLVLDQQHGGGLEAGDGMAGGEGEVVLGVNEQLDLFSKLRQLEIIGPGTGDQGLQGDIAHQHAQNQGCAHGPSDFPGFGEEQQDHRPGNPEDAALAKKGDDGHDKVQKAALQIGLEPLQNGQVKVHCQETHDFFHVFAPFVMKNARDWQIGV